MLFARALRCHLNRPITDCLRFERETTRWPVSLPIVSCWAPIRWLSRNGRLFVHAEDGWLSNNGTDIVSRYETWRLCCFHVEHTSTDTERPCMCVYVCVCGLTWSSLHDNGPGFSIQHLVRHGLHGGTSSRFSSKKRRSRFESISLSLSVRFFSKPLESKRIVTIIKGKSSDTLKSTWIYARYYFCAIQVKVTYLNIKIKS